MITKKELLRLTTVSEVNKGDEHLRLDRPIVFLVSLVVNKETWEFEVVGTGLTYGNWLIADGNRYLLTSVTFRRFSLEDERSFSLVAAA